MISRSSHGLIDYLFSIILIGMPYALGFSGLGAAHIVFWCVGFGSIVYSLLTNYRLGLVRVIPFRMHLILDVLGGFLLLASPWLFGFAESLWISPVVFGVLELGVVLLTRRDEEGI